MSRPGTQLLLQSLDPDAVARDVVERVLDHVTHCAFGLGPSIELRLLREGQPLTDPAEVALGTDLGLTVRALAAYAQRGLPVWDWTDHGMAADGLLSVQAALYARAADGALDGGAVDELDVDPDDPLGVVLVAALARVRLDRREALSPRELAVLAGLSGRTLRHLCSTGEIRATGGGGPTSQRVAWSEAERWLRARGVPGI